MPARVVVRPQAEIEILEVQAWYESRAPGLGSDFGQAIDALIKRMADTPLQFPRVHGETRRAVMARFPYAIYFRVDASDLVVLAVHGRQHPANWHKRT